MDLFKRDDLKTLLAEHPSPCISLFMPAHRGGAEEDPIRWRKHLAEAEERLAKAGWRAAEVKELLAPGRRLLEDIEFWKNQSDGLAAFLAPQFLRLFRLPFSFRDRVVVANRFSITPLLPLLSGNGRFFVLALSQHAVRLLQGTRYSISEADLKGVPRNLAEALLTHEAMQPFSFFGRRAGEGTGSWGGIFHGHGVGIDDSKEELLHYFQKIDRGLHPLLKEEKAPLVLAAVEYLQPIYCQANTYPQLLEQGVEGNPDRLSSQELHDRAWPLVQPLFEAEQQRAAAHYRQLAGTGHASGELEAIVAAAYEGRVETLFVALGHQVWGVFDPITSRVEQHKEAPFGDVDLLDLAAAHTLKHGRTVYAVEPEQVPSKTDVAAIFCLPLPKHGKRP
jgi:Bacterial archaeo-eukaryotic release factor family 3